MSVPCKFGHRRRDPSLPGLAPLLLLVSHEDTVGQALELPLIGGWQVGDNNLLFPWYVVRVVLTLSLEYGLGPLSVN